jgi:hypothetical protein
MPTAEARARLRSETRPKEGTMTLVWFIVWGISTLIGDSESLTFDPVNGWAAAFLLVLALDLARQHAPGQ